MKRIHLVISGDVQGVGYRAWAKRQAKDLDIVGWVKNRQDKAVELVGEGDDKALEELVKRCQNGPEVAWVKNIDVTWVPATNEFLNFEVLY